MEAYEDMIQHTPRLGAWIVVRRRQAAGASHRCRFGVDAMDDMKLAFPKVSAAQKKDLEAARKALESRRKRSSPGFLSLRIVVVQHGVEKHVEFASVS